MSNSKSEPSLQHFSRSFSLKWLLILIAAMAAVFAAMTQIGMGQAEFTIVENNLTFDERNLVEGVLRWNYTGTQHDGEKPWPFECKIRNIQNQELVKITPGSCAVVRYRQTALGPLKTQDPFAMYISGVLGINENSIVGYAILEDSTEVFIDGHKN